MDGLKPIPQLPLEIKEAALDGKLVLFVGAGASMLCGMPSWSGLALKALEGLRAAEKINYSELEQLKKLNPKIQLSIAKQIASSSGYDLQLPQYLQAEKGGRIYEIINSIKAACVTTNYDHELSPNLVEESEGEDGSKTKPSTRRVSGTENLKVSELKVPGTVTHLHGDVFNESQMIVSTADYLRHYDNEKVQFFLKDLFSNKTVLFIGYGLGEAEILEHILRRAETGSDEARRERFSLQPFFKSEEPLYQRLSSYYKDSFGVHLVGFTMDEGGYGQLEQVIENWADRLEVRSPALVDDMAEIDRVINE